MFKQLISSNFWPPNVYQVYPGPPPFQEGKSKRFSILSEWYDRRVRLFVAIFLPETAVLNVTALSRRAASPRLRWVPSESLHVTLKFLGETNPARLNEIDAALRRTASECSRFQIGLAGGGAFPNDRRPRIFWVGISGQTDKLAGLAAQTISTFSALGFADEERAFLPHLTVARCRSDARCLPDDGRAFAEAAATLQVAPFSVDTLHLVQSHTSGSGARYETLRRFPLAA